MIQRVAYRFGVSAFLSFSPSGGATAANKLCYYWSQDVKKTEGTVNRAGGQPDVVVHSPWAVDLAEVYPNQAWNGGALVLQDGPGRTASPTATLMKTINVNGNADFVITFNPDKQAVMNSKLGPDADASALLGGEYLSQKTFRSLLKKRDPAIGTTTIGYYEWGYSVTITKNANGDVIAAVEDVAPVWHEGAPAP